MAQLSVVWLCHFSNQEIKEYFNTPEVKEFAPWINILIELFKTRTEIDLHIVAPNVFTNTDSYFEKDGINYYFYKSTPIPNSNKYFRKIHSLLQFEYYTDYFWIKYKIKQIVNTIKPDIIHLHGAENPYYSAGILPLFNKYRILTTIQGFVRNSSQRSVYINKRVTIEELILKSSSHIGVRTEEMSKIALQLNPNATLHFHNYPIQYPKVVKTNIGHNESVDCIFFARITKDKGIEDLLKAISLVKEKNITVSLSVIGGVSRSYLLFLEKMCFELNILENVSFLGFFKTQEDIFKYAIQAKICVLPTYHDIIPGTIIESMLMKLPVIAYAVGGIPELNRNEETVILVEKLNIEELAAKILLSINNANLRIALAEKAYNNARDRFDNNKAVNDIVNAYIRIFEV